MKLPLASLRYLKSLYDMRDSTEPIEPSRVLSELLLGLRSPELFLRRWPGLCLKEPLGARATTFFKSIVGTCQHLKPARISVRSTPNCLRTLTTSTRITGTDLVDVVETLNRPFREAVVDGLTSSESSWKSYFGAGVSLLSRFIPRDCMVEFRLFVEVRCSELGTGKTLATWTTSSI